MDRLRPPKQSGVLAVDLMAGTGEVWPHLLNRFPELGTITALDISHRMHLEAVDRLHGEYADRITHFEADVLQTNLPTEHADLVVSTFGLKIFGTYQQTILAKQIARILKPGGSFSLIEASDPKGWIFRPFYRLYLDQVLPWVEWAILRGVHDFSMIGTYTRNFENSEYMAEALRDAGLFVTFKTHFFGCATSVAGHKPITLPTKILNSVDHPEINLHDNGFYQSRNSTGPNTLLNVVQSIMAVVIEYNLSV